MLLTIEDYRREIDRVEKALETTTSYHLKRDYTKYLKRLNAELNRALKFKKRR